MMANTSVAGLAVERPPNSIRYHEQNTGGTGTDRKINRKKKWGKFFENTTGYLLLFALTMLPVKLKQTTVRFTLLSAVDPSLDSQGPDWLQWESEYIQNACV